MQYEELMQLPYQEFLDEVLRDRPKDCVWTDVADWLATQYTAQQIAAMYGKLYEQLIIFTPDESDDKEDLEAADQLRDQMDVFCYATTNKEINKVLDVILEKNML
jgi:hypothetical protein